uniref:FAM13A-like domain-containing protein n=1 Tax=Pinguiococcus pyrenoidosus TaxID=172671 RepID=A0A7R9U7W0_9STRA|mmetsp:Transcript_17405/g.66301  ORF Transcript_17405/g.66301 Transcript_17405/m.66301 type:complete len:492 (+) Transcript_17405:69-1544(+)
MEVVSTVLSRLEAQAPLQIAWQELGRRGAGELKRAQETLSRPRNGSSDPVFLMDVLLYSLGALEPPLLPPDVYEAAEDACRSLGGHAPPPQLLQHILADLEKPRMDVLRSLFRFFRALADEDEATAQLLAQLVSPNLGRPAGAARLSLRHKEGLAAIEVFAKNCIMFSDVIFLRLDIAAPIPSPAPSPSSPSPSPTATAPSHAFVLMAIRSTVQEWTNPKRIHEALEAEERHEKESASAPAPAASSPAMFGPFGPRRVAGSLERRRMVQACRVLRTQITKFEERFAETHGHPPKGAERAPLGSTYAQYRSWKRFIREDAAQHIQRCFREHRRKKENQHATKKTKLLKQKRIVKQQLKAFDQDFYEKHGRLPKKAEKEPIRKLYEVYNGIKKEMEKYSAVEEAMDLESEVSASNAGDASSTEANPIIVFNDRHISLVDLRKERKILHRVLRQFEEDFKFRNGRDVSCAEDIAPVAQEYTKYKEIKKILSAYQ